jgi:hypothetical protein
MNTASFACTSTPSEEPVRRSRLRCSRGSRRDPERGSGRPSSSSGLCQPASKMRTAADRTFARPNLRRFSILMPWLMCTRPLCRYIRCVNSIRPPADTREPLRRADPVSTDSARDSEVAHLVAAAATLPSPTGLRGPPSPRSSDCWPRPACASLRRSRSTGMTLTSRPRPPPNRSPPMIARCRRLLAHLRSLPSLLLLQSIAHCYIGCTR